MTTEINPVQHHRSAVAIRPRCCLCALHPESQISRFATVALLVYVTLLARSSTVALGVCYTCVTIRVYYTCVTLRVYYTCVTLRRGRAQRVLHLSHTPLRSRSPCVLHLCHAPPRSRSACVTIVSRSALVRSIRVCYTRVMFSCGNTPGGRAHVGACGGCGAEATTYARRQC